MYNFTQCLVRTEAAALRHHHLVGTAGQHKQNLQRVGEALSWDPHLAEHRSTMRKGGRERGRGEGRVAFLACIEES